MLPFLSGNLYGFYQNSSRKHLSCSPDLGTQFIGVHSSSHLLFLLQTPPVPIPPLLEEKHHGSPQFCFVTALQSVVSSRWEWRAIIPERTQVALQLRIWLQKAMGLLSKSRLPIHDQSNWFCCQDNDNYLLVRCSSPDLGFQRGGPK